jgi:predicted DNA-binding transcriptional regulator AlpA
MKVLIQGEVQTRDLPTFPETGFVRIKQILGVIPIAEPTWWKWVRIGKAPRGYKFGPNITAWRVEDIRALIAKLGER